MSSLGVDPAGDLNSREWVEEFIKSQLFALECAFHTADACAELPDQFKLDRQMYAISRCVAACDAYPGPLLERVRRLAVDYLLPSEEIEKAIAYGREQAETAREYRKTTPAPQRWPPNGSDASRPTSRSAIHALLHELRSGLSTLADASTLDRLRHCDEAAMREIGRVLLTWKDKHKPWLPPWKEGDIETLLKIRRGLT